MDGRNNPPPSRNPRRWVNPNYIAPNNAPTNPPAPSTNPPARYVNANYIDPNTAGNNPPTNPIAPVYRTVAPPPINPPAAPAPSNPPFPPIGTAAQPVYVQTSFVQQQNDRTIAMLVHILNQLPPALQNQCRPVVYPVIQRYNQIQPQYLQLMLQYNQIFSQMAIQLNNLLIQMLMAMGRGVPAPAPAPAQNVTDPWGTPDGNNPVP